MNLPHPFEIHLTVDVQNSIVLSQRFLSLCQDIQAKALEIILARGEYPKQMMLSKVIMAHRLPEILLQIQQWHVLFKQHQLDILRTKIEVPFYADIQDNIQYYEWHGLVEYQDVLQLEQLCDEQGVHLSYNALKGQQNFRFMTLREYTAPEQFEIKLKKLKQRLHEQKRHILKEISEICIYDSNIDLDQGWLDTIGNG